MLSILLEDQVKATQKDILSPAQLFSTTILPSKRGWLPCTLLAAYEHQIDVEDMIYLKSKHAMEGGNGNHQPEIHAKQLKQISASPPGPKSQKKNDHSSMSHCQRTSTQKFENEISRKGYFYSHDEVEADWLANVEELHLERQKLKSMQSFDKLPNLRQLFLSENKISVIEGLENCSLLEELILNGNNITQVKSPHSCVCDLISERN